MTTVTVEITVWDESKVPALLRKVEGDARVVSVSVLSGGES